MITVNVINDAPVIYAEEQTISAGAPFYPLDYVTASDTEDEDLIKKITALFLFKKEFCINKR